MPEDDWSNRMTKLMVLREDLGDVKKRFNALLEGMPEDDRKELAEAIAIETAKLIAIYEHINGKLDNKEKKDV